jgi:hypothetical protein
MHWRIADHTPYATKAIKKVLGEDYCYDCTNTFRSLYRNFTLCQFIEDRGDIVFYRDARGVTTRQMDGSLSPQLDGSGIVF